MYEYDPNTFEFDSDGDGYYDSIATYGDLDGDGVAESIIASSDTDFDGYYETVTVQSDTNGDGYIDTVTQEADTNNSGMADIAVMQQDTDGDGYFETINRYNDYNQDGEYDSVKTHEDLNADGAYEKLTKVYDSDSDGSPDTAEVFYDETGTGTTDQHEVYAYDPGSGEIVPAAASNYTIGGTNWQELDQYDPATSDPDKVTGDPESSMEHWEFQGDTNRCALYSQKFVIEELTGQEIDIEEFAQVAKENGWFTEEGGTTYLNTNQMLDYYGVENEMKFHQSMEDIEECLDNGGRVIVSIDSDETWHGKDNNIFAPDSSSDHAVEVIGIDRTDPDNPMVILNDSGSPYGKGEMVPLEVFEGAWSEGDNQMIVCYPS